MERTVRISDFNFRHLLYFHTVVREGSVTAAAKALYVTQPTVSAQLRQFEEDLGTELLEREGRGVRPTHAGLVVARYAGEIFGLGTELIAAVQGGAETSLTKVVVGVADVLPKLVVAHLLEPVLRLADVRIECRSGHPDELIADLAVHRLDVVLADAPVGPGQHIRAFNHHLGGCGVSFLATPDRAAELCADFPASLDGQPMLMPAKNTVLRRSLDSWFDRNDVHPSLAGEFEDSTFIKVFGGQGLGFFAVPSVIAPEVQEQYGVVCIGQTDEVEERFYAISTERRLRNPAVVALTKAARSQMFDLDT
ncbi:MAG: LysR family transcriptional activator of nhaA [Bradymonadia bacterium]|jgi:LysR family transcriptional activator of nhaA